MGTIAPSQVIPKAPASRVSAEGTSSAVNPGKKKSKKSHGTQSLKSPFGKVYKGALNRVLAGNPEGSAPPSGRRGPDGSEENPPGPIGPDGKARRKKAAETGSPELLSALDSPVVPVIPEKSAPGPGEKAGGKAPVRGPVLWGPKGLHEGAVPEPGTPALSPLKAGSGALSKESPSDSGPPVNPSSIDLASGTLPVSSGKGDSAAGEGEGDSGKNPGEGFPDKSTPGTGLSAGLERERASTGSGEVFRTGSRFLGGNLSADRPGGPDSGPASAAPPGTGAGSSVIPGDMIPPAGGALPGTAAAPSGPDGENGTPVLPPRMEGRVVSLAQEGGGQVSLEVKPPHLGPVGVRVRIDPHTRLVSVELRSHDPRVRHLLSIKEDSIKESLSRSGFVLDRFQVAQSPPPAFTGSQDSLGQILSGQNPSGTSSDTGRGGSSDSGNSGGGSFQAPGQDAGGFARQGSGGQGFPLAGGEGFSAGRGSGHPDSEESPAGGEERAVPGLSGVESLRYGQGFHRIA